MTAWVHGVRARSTAVVGAVLAALVVVLTGCGSQDPDEGTNGVGRLSATEIEERARKAARAAGSVRLSGSVVSQGRTYRLDMRLTGDGGIGEVLAKGGPRFELLRIGEELYLKAGADFWVHQEQDGEEPNDSDLAAARKLEGKYVKVPTGDPAHRQLSGFTDKDVLLEGLIALQGKREKGARDEVDGVRTIEVRAGKGEGGVLSVALIGTPYPLRLERGGGAGVVELTEWDKEFALRAPEEEQVVDYGKKISAAE
ncbi:hypothetical protein V1L54_07185 [Streptomyces sp. TRM 70361]|uniref:hypothetical protein n=1 Tax=Streptomyces sp. TRM 70361 TaxID=3116553 RepID=UPI002E7BD662|nr:hypothetical protein [Streptomyces sp. TRM 70361]MEE1939196.1 hypothetical protein [Streptomyces sp. TRM 70361]